jgi:hypothetical protein
MEKVNTSVLNAAQKRGLFITFAAAIIVAVFHNPFHGYTSDYTYSIPGIPMPSDIQPPSKSVRDVLTRAEFDELVAQDNRFTIAQNNSLPQWHTVERSFTEWQSDGAFVPALSSISNFFFVEAAILLLGACWIWLFRTSKDHS